MTAASSSSASISPATFEIKSANLPLVALLLKSADLVLLDPTRIQDKATYEKPRLMCEGIERVMVNGQWAFAKGQATGSYTGRFLRR